MIADLRRRFNAEFTAQKYDQLLQHMESRCGMPVPFRVSETPCFFPAVLIERMCQVGAELLAQLVSDEYRRASDRSIPAEFRVPNESPHPLFVQVDFGLVRDASGELQPRLVELQGFPSLYAYQPELAQAYLDVFGIDKRLKTFLGGLDRPSYTALLRRVIAGDHDPENVILMEIDPVHQKTAPDFVLTEKLLGVKAIDISTIEKSGRRLFYTSNGKRVPIQRIYNRAIVDELIRRKTSLDFRLTDDLEVEWAGHPNWFFRMSKFSLPFLRHECVPESRFLSDVDDVSDLSDYVLKPLFSFAGLGISLHPTRAELSAIPRERRADYILQKKMNFEPVIETPFGLTKAEIRIMYIWDEKPLPVLTIIRMGRGQMMGVDHNKNMQWVGSSAGLYAPNA